MDKPKPDLPTVDILGMTLPVIADLQGGWWLVAQPCGAAIATDTILVLLRADSIAVPECVRAKAVEEFERLAWPLVRGQFYW